MSVIALSFATIMSVVVVPSWRAKRLPLLCQSDKCFPAAKRGCNYSHSVFGHKDGSFEGFVYLVSEYKTQPCAIKHAHQYTACAYYHQDDGQDKRRPPDSVFVETGPARVCACDEGEHCFHAHSMLEALYHPATFRTRMCTRKKCYKLICAFAHSREELERCKRHREHYYAMMESKQLARVAKSTQEFEQVVQQQQKKQEQVQAKVEEESVSIGEPTPADENASVSQQTGSAAATDVDAWTVDDVVAWLNRVHLEFLADEVKKQRVRGKLLRVIDDATLQRDFHEVSTFRRMRVLGEIEELLGMHA
jgi:hypothetical protein